MRTTLLLLCFLASYFSGEAQVDFAIKAGIAPLKVMGTAPLVVNRHDPTADFLFNGTKVEYSPSLGVAMKYNTKHFFFEAEAIYNSIRRSYEMQYIENNLRAESMHQMKETCKAIDFPLSAGVKLGVVEVRSGFSLRYEFAQSSTLSQMQGFKSKIDNTVFGWHSGLGLNFGRISAELRYHQDFANYGQGIFVNDQELLLKNAPARFQFMVGMWF
jgi:hypothetical protein